MPISDLLAQINGEVPTSLPLPNPVQKRKADEDLPRMNDKLVKREQPPAEMLKATSQGKKPTSLSSSIAKPRPGIPASTTPKANLLRASSGTGPAIPSPTEPAKPPKKGSYAEILARGKAAQATLGQVGKIRHKPVAKGLSKRERQELKEQESQLHRRSKKSTHSGMRVAVRDGRKEVRQSNGKLSTKVSTLPEKKIKKAALATTGYTGTARPNPTALKSSLKSTSASRTVGKDHYGQYAFSSRRVAYASEKEEDEEDEDEEDEEDEEDYESDSSSDMEAAVFEVDEEEERAARIARREDEEALREEARLRREKEEKRRKLAAMAKSRR